MNVDVLSKILTSTESYWILKKCYSDNSKPGILMVAIPFPIRQGIKRDAIKLIDLEELQQLILHGNIFLNENYPPFQEGQTLSNVTEAYPIVCNQKEFLIRSLLLKSDNMLEYKKLIDELKTKEDELKTR